MRSRSAVLGAGVAVVAAGIALAAPEQKVELVLANGEKVEGKLVDFGERVYRVDVAGKVREISEKDVKEVRFVRDAAPAGGGKVPARLSLKDGEQLAYARRSKLAVSLERGGELPSKSRETAELSLDQTLEAAPRPDGSARLAAKIGKAVIARKLEGSRSADESWELPSGTALSLEVSADPRGRALSATPRLRGLFDAAGGKLAKIPMLYLFGVDSAANTFDGSFTGAGPTLPEEPAEQWTVVVARPVGLTGGLCDDYSQLEETWDWRVTGVEKDALLVSGTLARVRSVKAFRGSLTVDSARGSATAKLHATKGVILSADVQTSLAFTAGESKGTFERTDSIRLGEIREVVRAPDPAGAGERRLSIDLSKYRHPACLFSALDGRVEAPPADDRELETRADADLWLEPRDPEIAALAGAGTAVAPAGSGEKVFLALAKPPAEAWKKRLSRDEVAAQAVFWLRTREGRFAKVMIEKLDERSIDLRWVVLPGDEARSPWERPLPVDALSAARLDDWAVYECTEENFESAGRVNQGEVEARVAEVGERLRFDVKATEPLDRFPVKDVPVRGATLEAFVTAAWGFLGDPHHTGRAPTLRSEGVTVRRDALERLGRRLEVTRVEVTLADTATNLLTTAARWKLTLWLSAEAGPLGLVSARCEGETRANGTARLALDLVGTGSGTTARSGRAFGARPSFASPVVGLAPRRGEGEWTSYRWSFVRGSFVRGKHEASGTTTFVNHTATGFAREQHDPAQHDAYELGEGQVPLDVVRWVLRNGVRKDVGLTDTFELESMDTTDVTMPFGGRDRRCRRVRAAGRITGPRSEGWRFELSATFSNDVSACGLVELVCDTKNQKGGVHQTTRFVIAGAGKGEKVEWGARLPTEGRKANPLH